jgi:hypothetical protein
VYAFYNHNTDNVRWAKSDPEVFEDGKCPRVDSLGHFVYRYSDDNGLTWSDPRREVPVREMEIDRENPYGGELRYFWTVGRCIAVDGAGYVPLHKVGALGRGFFTRSEGVFIKSDNILTERDPDKLNWETVPDGDAGLRSVAGPVAEEHSITYLSDGSLYSVYRTIEGYPCHAYSRDGGHTWTAPEYMTYTPGGRRVKNPRAANFAWRCSNGKFVYWFENHSREGLQPIKGYLDRNPAWLCGGVEKDGHIYWSQPEIVLFDDDPAVRMSYPDFVEENGKYFITETQKEIARTHEIDPTLLEGMWGQFGPGTVARDKDLILDLTPEQRASGSTVALPGLPHINRGGGFAVDFWVKFDSLAPHQILFEARRGDYRGFTIETTRNGTIRIAMSDRRTEGSWECDRGLLKPDTWHHVGIVVDGGPKIITFTVDGQLCDGADQRQFGWGRFSPHMRRIFNDEAVVAPTLQGELGRLRLYRRYLRTSEVVGNYNAERDEFA